MPTSRDPEKRAIQLANLNNSPPAPPVGNQRGLRHGAYARLSEVDLDAKTREIFVAISEDAPVRSSDGGLPAHDTIAVRLLAEVLIRRDRVRAEELAHGLEIASGPRKGALRGVVEYGLRLDGQALDLLDRLGMTPAARAKLGLDLARAARTLEDEVAAGPGWDAESDARVPDDGHQVVGHRLPGDDRRLDGDDDGRALPGDDRHRVDRSARDRVIEHVDVRSGPGDDEVGS